MNIDTDMDHDDRMVLGFMAIASFTFFYSYPDIMLGVTFALGGLAAAAYGIGTAFDYIITYIKDRYL